MNVLILSTHLNSGGITTYIINLTKGLKRSGHRVYIVTSGGNMVEAAVALGAEHITCDIRTKSELSPKIYFTLLKLRRLVKEKNIDIIHAQTRVTQVMGMLLGRWIKTPYVSTCHGFYKKRFSRRFLPCWGDGVIAISQAVQNHLIKDFNVKKDNIALIHHGIKIERYPLIVESMRGSRRKELGIKGGPVIGIIARLADIKGHKVLLSAMAHVVKKNPGVLLLIVGTGRMEEELKKITADLGLQNNVTFLPIVEQPFACLAALDLFVMPSLEEGLGLSLMEAQAAGLPVVASRTGGIVDLIEEGKTGILVPPGDADALSEAILRLLANPVEARAIGLAARQFIQNEFTIEKMMAKTVSFYQKVARK